MFRYSAAGRKLGDANLAYAMKEFPNAIELLQEVGAALMYIVDLVSLYSFF